MSNSTVTIVLCRVSAAAVPESTPDSSGNHHWEKCGTSRGSGLNDRGAFGRLPGSSYWQIRCAEECARAERYRLAFVVVLLQATDPIALSGRACPPSDGVMAVVAESLRGAVRASDVLCRLGPAMFGMLLVGTEHTGAQAVIRRLPGIIQRNICATLSPGMMPRITIGHALYPQHGTHPQDLRAAALTVLKQRRLRTAEAVVQG